MEDSRSPGHQKGKTEADMGKAINFVHERMSRSLSIDFYLSFFP